MAEEGRFVLSIRNRSDGTEIWTQKRGIRNSDALVTTAQGSNEGGAAGGPHEDSFATLTDEEFKASMLAVYEALYHEYGMLLLRRATEAPMLASQPNIGATIIFTSIYGEGILDNWALDNCYDQAWNSGKHPVIRLDRKDLKTPTKAAVALYAAVFKIFDGYLSPDAFKPAPVLDTAGFDSETAAMIQDLRVGRFHRMGQVLKDASDAGAMGVSILSNVGGIVISVGLAEKSDANLNLLLSTARFLPFVGKYTTRVGRTLSIRFSSNILGHVDEIIIPATASKALIDALEVLGQGNRVASMRALRPLIESGEVSPHWIELWVKAGWLEIKQLKPWDQAGDYKILQKNIEELTGIKWVEATEARHHDLVVATGGATGSSRNFTLEFLKRGLDPNDGRYGRFIPKGFHDDVIHGAQNLYGPGGRWNERWEAFFAKYGDAATGSMIESYLEKLRSATSDYTKRFDEINWPDP